LGPYVKGWAGWCHGIAKPFGLPQSKAFVFGQICRQGGEFDACYAGGLAIRIVCGFYEGHAGGLAGSLIGGHPWNWWPRLHEAHESSVIIAMGSVNA
jgi:hypothetical protein